ncbi:MAG: rod shape-determining protein RodA [Candidatus Aminicenantales bacterium]
MIDRRQIQNIDWVLLVYLLLNSVIGVIIIYSGSHYLQGNFYLKQIFWIIAGLTALLLLISIDYKFLVAWSFYIYILFVGVLGGLLLFGKSVAGTKGWIKLPFFQVQPSELMKIALILLLAYLFSDYRRNSLSWKKMSVCCAIFAMPTLLVSLQPDLGTALSYTPILLAALILAGLNRKMLIILLIAALLFSVVGWSVVLRDYQKERIKILVSPGHDPLGAGYHIQQSKIAIGSGGFLGKGYKRGTQSQLRFLPARHTDFVFSVIGEELGFLGVLGVLLCYFLLLSRLFSSVKDSRDRAGVYIIFMVAVMISAQFFINVLMVIGFFPIAGIPLPLLSYGGSSLLTTYLGVSLVLNVKMRRFANI